MSDQQHYQTEQGWDFKIESELGAGYTSLVYRAQVINYPTDWQDPPRQVALKVLRPGALHEDVQRLKDERSTLQALWGASGHHVPRVYTVQEEQEPYFLAMDLAGGERVTDWLDLTGAFPEQEALDVVAQFLAVLHALHTRLERTYKDLQFRNLYWERERQHLTVLDLNVLSKHRSVMDESQWQAGVRADLDHAAAYLYRLLTGEETLTGEGRRALASRGSRWADLSPGTRAVLTRALNADPQERYPDAGGMQAAVEQQLSEWQTKPEKLYAALPDLGQMDKLDGAALLAAQNRAFVLAHRQDVPPHLEEFIVPIWEQLQAFGVGALARGRRLFRTGGKASLQKAGQAFEQARQEGAGLAAYRWLIVIRALQQAWRREERWAGDALRDALVEALPALEDERVPAEGWETIEQALKDLKVLVGPGPLERIGWEVELRKRVAVAQSVLDQSDMPHSERYAAAADAFQKAAQKLAKIGDDTYRQLLAIEVGDLAAQAARYRSERARWQEVEGAQNTLRHVLDTPDWWRDADRSREIERLLDVSVGAVMPLLWDQGREWIEQGHLTAAYYLHRRALSCVAGTGWEAPVRKLEQSLRYWVWARRRWDEKQYAAVLQDVERGRQAVQDALYLSSLQEKATKDVASGEIVLTPLLERVLAALQRLRDKAQVKYQVGQGQYAEALHTLRQGPVEDGKQDDASHTRTEARIFEAWAKAAIDRAKDLIKAHDYVTALEHVREAHAALEAQGASAAQRQRLVDAQEWVADAWAAATIDRARQHVQAEGHTEALRHLQATRRTLEDAQVPEASQEVLAREIEQTGTQWAEAEVEDARELAQTGKYEAALRHLETAQRTLEDAQVPAAPREILARAIEQMGTQWAQAEAGHARTLIQEEDYAAALRYLREAQQTLEDAQVPVAPRETLAREIEQTVEQWMQVEVERAQALAEQDRYSEALQSVRRAMTALAQQKTGQDTTRSLQDAGQKIARQGLDAAREASRQDLNVNHYDEAREAVQEGLAVLDVWPEAEGANTRAELFEPLLSTLGTETLMEEVERELVSCARAAGLDERVEQVLARKRKADITRRLNDVAQELSKVSQKAEDQPAASATIEKLAEGLKAMQIELEWQKLRAQIKAALGESELQEAERGWAEVEQQLEDLRPRVSTLSEGKSKLAEIDAQFQTAESAEALDQVGDRYAELLEQLPSQAPNEFEQEIRVRQEVTRSLAEQWRQVHLGLAAYLNGQGQPALAVDANIKKIKATFDKLAIVPVHLREQIEHYEQKKEVQDAATDLREVARALQNYDQPELARQVWQAVRRLQRLRIFVLVLGGMLLLGLAALAWQPDLPRQVANAITGAASPPTAVAALTPSSPAEAPDADGDGLSDADEATHGTDLTNPDNDGDGLTDGDDVNTHGTDPNKADGDDDGLTDGDDVNTHGTDPNKADGDDDGLTDGDEVNTHETDPNKADSDDDGLTDGDEVNTHGTDPNKADSDGDGLPDGDEVNTHETDPNKADSDDDGLTDGDEVNTHGTDPSKADSDGDRLTDGDEVNTHGTDPNKADSDGDGLPDGDEVSQGTNPLAPALPFDFPPMDARYPTMPWEIVLSSTEPLTLSLFLAPVQPLAQPLTVTLNDVTTTLATKGPWTLTETLDAEAPQDQEPYVYRWTRAANDLAALPAGEYVLWARPIGETEAQEWWVSFRLDPAQAVTATVAIEQNALIRPLPEESGVHQGKAAPDETVDVLGQVDQEDGAWCFFENVVGLRGWTRCGFFAFATEGTLDTVPSLAP
jgi:hypothetical protein